MEDASGGLVRVLYIAGISHNGSTIVGHVLGEVEDFFYGGEVRNIWQRGVIENRLCTCGHNFRECAFWSAVLADSLPQLSIEEALDLANLHSRYARLRCAPAMWRSRAPDLERYRASISTLYTSIGAVADARVVVDSSKSPWYAWILATTPGIDLNIVHLVRDPRANIYSFTRRGFSQPRDLTTRALRWDTWNTATEILAHASGVKLVRLRYEDFVANPRNQLERALHGLEIDAPVPPFVGSQVRLRPKHIFSGNRSRGVVGEVELRSDDEWQRALSRTIQAAIAALTFPLLHRYGYQRRLTRAPDE